MIHNVIFDLGNVLLTFDSYSYLTKHYTIEEAEFLYSAIFDSAEWIALDRGDVKKEEALRRISMQYPEKRDLLTHVMADYHHMFSPIASSVAVLTYLKAHEYKLFFLTNFHFEAFEYVHSCYEFFTLFDGGVLSSELAMLKPEKAIYMKLVHEYGINPKESIFIDDTLENIEAAKKIGFQVIHLKNPLMLSKALKKYGIKGIGGQE